MPSCFDHGITVTTPDAHVMVGAHKGNSMPFRLSHAIGFIRRRSGRLGRDQPLAESGVRRAGGGESRAKDGPGLSTTPRVGLAGGSGVGRAGGVESRAKDGLSTTPRVGLAGGSGVGRAGGVESCAKDGPGLSTTPRVRLAGMLWSSLVRYRFAEVLCCFEGSLADLVVSRSWSLALWMALAMLGENFLRPRVMPIALLDAHTKRCLSGEEPVGEIRVGDCLLDLG